MPKSPAEVLREAAGLIETNGLARGTFYNPSAECYCAVGTISHILHGHPSNYDADEMRLYADLLIEAGATYPQPLDYDVSEVATIFYWSDSHTVAEVAETMRKAADLADVA